MAVFAVRLERKEHTSSYGITRATDFATWTVDGENVAQLVARTTSCEADNYRTCLRAATVLAPDANMLGRTGPMWQYFTGEPALGIVPLLICSCGIEGCMSLIADVEITRDHVSWRRLRHATAADHPGQSWTGSAPPDLIFDRTQYERELARHTSDNHADGEPPPTPEELAFMRERFTRWRDGGPRP